MKNMKKVTFTRREFIDKYTCIDTPITRRFIDFWRPEGASVVYFRQNQFSVFVVDADDIVSIENIEE